MVAGKLPVDEELVDALRMFIENTGASFVSAAFEVPDTDLELVVTLRYKEEEG